MDRLIDREVPLETTIAVVQSLRTRYGITRIADTTRLDRIGIPTVSAIVPNSPDGLGVYNGIGLTREAALAGALMEAIERQICARFEGVNVFDARLTEVDRVLDLRSLGWIGAIEDASASAVVGCVRGINLLDWSPVDVPVGAVRCPRIGERFFQHTSTNGLASGNTWNEAVYHALMELVERHLWSRVHVLSHIWPRTLRARLGKLDLPDDPVAYEVIDALDNPVLAPSVRPILEAGLRFRLLTYSELGWPCAMMACIVDPAGDGLFYHLGFGCSWSPLHAAIRAITEAVQVRVTDIQGAREDIKRAGDVLVRDLDHGRRPASFPIGGRWYYDGPALPLRLIDLSNDSRGTLTADIAQTLEVMDHWGETCVACVDLTPTDLPLRVVRIVAPHLERTLVDGTISGRLSTFLDNPLASIR
ncbi:MAG TPA: YcaO-like family protein [Candidatus Baltobacteraceae bacterium]|nr:YcaO-like family protein [Candidatus Baltobacteraceae bacterium]